MTDALEMTGKIQARVKLPQAAGNEPHWIVMCLSHGDREQGPRPRTDWRFLFRHPTEQLANRECDRLAAARPGHRFAVYGSGYSTKVLKPKAEES